MTRNSEQLMPAVCETETGAMRRVGVELEFIGLDALEAARIVQKLIQGEISEISEYEYVIKGDPAGEWQVERDFALLKEIGQKKSRQTEDPTLIESATEQTLKAGSEILVPLEIIGPPLPLERLPEFQSIVTALQKAGARGTDDSLLYAFGLQFNPELPALDAVTIRRYLQAFVCLQDWLFDQTVVDAARQLTSYAEPFSPDYIARIIGKDYQPSMDALIDDYLADNPTRNRALDMLPLFLQLDEGRVRAVVVDERVKPRPTFHYRLPNSNIGQKDWTIFEAWQDWLQVEWLASEPKLLRELCAQYETYLAKPLSGIRSDWKNTVDKWLTENH